MLRFCCRKSVNLRRKRCGTDGLPRGANAKCAAPAGPGGGPAHQCFQSSWNGSAAAPPTPASGQNGSNAAAVSATAAAAAVAAEHRCNAEDTGGAVQEEM